VTNKTKSTFRVDLEPVGRRAEIDGGNTLLDAARAAGVDLVSLCGGEGWCHGCAVRIAEGALTPPTSEEQDAFSPDELEAGFRLA
jgi:ferredoxin